MEKINKLFTKDIGLKVISIVIAVCLWYMVINIENPIETKNITVSVASSNLSNIENSKYAILEDDKLSSLQTTLKVRGNRLSLDRLIQSKDKISANIDFSKVTSEELKNGKFYVKIDVSLPTIAGSSFELLSKSPETLEFTVSEITELQKDVNVTLSGVASNEYIVSDFSATPKRVTLKGTLLAISSVDKVTATVTADDFKNNDVVYSTPIPLDKDGNIVPDVSITPKEVIVTGGISKTKKVPIYLNTVGDLKDGFVVSAFDYSPKEITIIGSEELLSKINNIILPNVDISGLDSDFSGEILLNDFLSQGIMIDKNESGLLKFKLSIGKKSEKEITIPSSNISLLGEVPPDITVNYQKEDIKVTISGDETTLASIDGNNITAKINISGLEEGKYKLNYELDLPKGISLTGKTPYISVSITKNES